MKKKVTTRQAARLKGYRSGLEETIDNGLKLVGVDGEYEQHKITYTKPATQHKYTPDFKLPNGIFVETKGRFVTADRKKHLLIKEQHPELDIRFVFQNANNRLSKKSKTTYADWCNKHGFLFAEKEIPKEWLSQ
jgi:Phage endonuclease I